MKINRGDDRTNSVVAQAHEIVRQAKPELALAKKTGEPKQVNHAFTRLQRARVAAAHVRRYRSRLRDDVFANLPEIAGA